MIEKHFTHDRYADGPDHMTSLDPKGFAEMVAGIRTVQNAMGDGIKRVMPCEEETVKIVQERKEWAAQLS